MPTFRADCSNCCGLCCVVFHLPVDQGFPVEKPAHTPCAHLDRLHRCSIHATRRMEGYVGCEGYDCFGAGQWVTQSLFGGAHWTDCSELAPRMFAAFRHWAPRFEAAALIEAALSHVREDAKDILIERMKSLTTVATGDRLSPTDGQRLHRETLAMIRAALPSDRASRVPDVP